MSTKIRLKSVYENAAAQDGSRYLAETFWPEGVETRTLIPCGWAREIAPSYYLIETARWKHWHREQFRAEYERELQEPDRRERLREIVREARAGQVTLLHKSRKEEYLVGPEDTSVYDLREILEAVIEREEMKAVPPDSKPEENGAASCAADAWSNEGGQ